jgi:DNA-binding response OmpR family regulator
MTRILLVEDDADVRVVFEHVLVDASYEVDTTQSVGGGRDLLTCRNYDLIVADGRLPDGTGMMLADEGRAKGIPALIVTGYAFSLREDNGGTDLAPYNVLLKPIRPHELLTAVSAALRA